MQTTMNTESQISDYFMNSGTALTTEKQVIAAVHAELAHAKTHVSDKDIVLGLIHRWRVSVTWLSRIFTVRRLNMFCSALRRPATAKNLCLL